MWEGNVLLSSEGRILFAGNVWRDAYLGVGKTIFAFLSAMRNVFSFENCALAAERNRSLCIFAPNENGWCFFV